MVSRNHGRCRICGRVFAIRVTVAGGLQRFVFACPYCDSQMTGSFYAEQPTRPDSPLKPFELKSEDFEPLEYDPAREEPGTLAVAVNTEIPVHVSLLASPAGEPSRTPFIQFIDAAGLDPESLERINLLRQMRFALLPLVRAGAAFYAQGKMDKVAEVLARLGEPIAPQPWEAVGILLQKFLEVLGAGPGRDAARDELTGLIKHAYMYDEEATQALLSEWAQRMLPLHRQRVLDTLVAALWANDALVPGLCLEAAPDLDLDVVRVQRADFDELKVRFQDIFELGSRTIVVPASLANVVRRGDARLYPDGVRRSPGKALKAKAVTREKWLDDLPAAKALHDDAARRTRNLIGHSLVGYDYARAALVDDAGEAFNYLEFLRDYLASVRSCAYQLDVVELLTAIELQPGGTPPGRAASA